MHARSPADCNLHKMLSAVRKQQIGSVAGVHICRLHTDLRRNATSSANGGCLCQHLKDPAQQCSCEFAYHNHYRSMPSKGLNYIQGEELEGGAGVRLPPGAPPICLTVLSPATFVMRRVWSSDMLLLSLSQDLRS